MGNDFILIGGSDESEEKEQAGVSYTPTPQESYTGQQRYEYYQAGRKEEQPYQQPPKPPIDKKKIREAAWARR